MSLSAPTPQVPAAPLPPTPAQAPMGERPKKKSSTPSFLGAEMSAPNQSGGGSGKTLLGQ